MMRKMFLIVVTALFLFNSQAEDVKLKESTVGERLILVFASAQTYVKKYESINGDAAGKKIAKYINDELDASSDQILDAQMIKKFSDIKEKHEKKKEMEPKLIYEACFLLLCYQTKPLPTCIQDVFKENPDAVGDMLKIISDNTMALGPEQVLLVKKETKEP
jgi:hypothetical protein